MTGPVAVNRPMTATEWGLLLALSVLWGGSFFFNQVAIADLPTFTVVTARLVLGALILLSVLRIAGKRLPATREAWVAFYVVGLLQNAVPFSLIVWAQGHIGSGVASILNATTPLFTVLLAHVMTDDDKLTPGRLVGILLGLAGVAVMIGIAALQSFGVHVVAQLAMLAATFSYAVSGNFGRRFRTMGIEPLSVATGQLIASSSILLPVMILVERPWVLPMPGLHTMASLVALGALSTALAYVIFFRILSTAGATNLMLVTFLIPVTSILLGVGILGEVLLPRHIAGMALIGLGLAAIDGRPARALGRILGRSGRARRHP